MEGAQCRWAARRSSSSMQGAPVGRTTNAVLGGGDVAASFSPPNATAGRQRASRTRGRARRRATRAMQIAAALTPRRRAKFKFALDGYFIRLWLGERIHVPRVAPQRWRVLHAARRRVDATHHATSRLRRRLPDRPLLLERVHRRIHLRAAPPRLTTAATSASTSASTSATATTATTAATATAAVATLAAHHDGHKARGC